MPQNPRVPDPYLVASSAELGQLYGYTSTITAVAIMASIGGANTCCTDMSPGLSVMLVVQIGAHLCQETHMFNIKQ